MNYSEEQLKRIYADLPKDIREAMFSVATAKAISEITKSFNLHINQVGDVAEETGNIMLGLTKPQDFKKRLSSRLPELNDKDIDSIATQINERVFSRIRTSMEDIHAEHEESEEPHKTPANNDTDKIFEDRMSKLFNIPQKKIEEKPKEEPPKYKLKDPYRESIE